MKKKICIITPTFLPKTGGSQIGIFNIAKKLADFKKEFDIHLFVPYSNYIKLDKTKFNFKIHSMPPKLWWVLKFNNKIAFTIFNIYFLIYFFKYKFDFTIVNLAYPTGVMFSNFSKKFKKTPFIVICPGEDIQKNKTINYGLRLNSQIDNLVKKHLKFANYLIALTKGIKKEFTKIDVPLNNIKEINYGIDEKIYSIKDSKSAIRRKLKIPGNKFVYFCCGRNHPKKNFKILISAAIELKKKYNDFIIMITGKNTEELIPLIKKNNLGNYFILNDEIPYLDKNFKFPNKELLLHFKASDAFVFPSNLETFGIVLIEAMACNLPIITSDAEGCVDVIENGKFGLIFKRNNIKELVSKMIKIRNNNTKLRYITKSKERIKDFALTNIIQEYRKLILND
tara:strand:+ start:17 stop:1204 length:1188 start_codon:yes stop_codon:yes gene_type:complete